MLRQKFGSQVHHDLITSVVNDDNRVSPLSRREAYLIGFQLLVWTPRAEVVWDGRNVQEKYHRNGKTAGYQPGFSASLKNGNADEE